LINFYESLQKEEEKVEDEGFENKEEV